MMEPIDKPTVKTIVQRIKSAEIFKQAKEVIIVHGEEEYRLKITKAGKLILNK